MRVSIHASVKDATRFRDIAGKLYPVSIHASVKDATPVVTIVPNESEVSIHASVKDATDAGRFGERGNSFNPRICKRCDKQYLL